MMAEIFSLEAAISHGVCVSLKPTLWLAILLHCVILAVGVENARRILKNPTGCLHYLGLCEGLRAEAQEMGNKKEKLNSQ